MEKDVQQISVTLSKSKTSKMTTKKRDRGLQGKRKKKITKILHKILAHQHQLRGKWQTHLSCLEGQLRRTSDIHYPIQDQPRKVIYALRNTGLAGTQVSDFNCSTLITKAIQSGQAGREMKDQSRLLRANLSAMQVAGQALILLDGK